MKRCTKCLVDKPLTEFYKEGRSRDGLRTDCKICSNNRRRNRLGQLSREERVRRTAERRLKHAKEERAYSAQRRRDYRANELIRLARVRATKKGLPFDLDKHVQELTARVGKNCCEMTGVELQRAVPKAYNSPSLDRIVPEKGYVYSNVRVICYALNCALGTWGVDVLTTLVEELPKRSS